MPRLKLLMTKRKRMVMPKRKSVASVEAKIKVTQQKIVKAKARYDRLCAELSDLKHERDEAVALEILRNYA